MSTERTLRMLGDLYVPGVSRMGERRRELRREGTKHPCQVLDMQLVRDVRRFHTARRGGIHPAANSPAPSEPDDGRLRCRAEQRRQWRRADDACVIPQAVPQTVP